MAVKFLNPHANRMRHTILLVSKDKALLDTRSLLLESVGYSTLKVTTLTGAIGLAFLCRLAIIDTTFTSSRHEEFINHVHADRPNIVVLSLRMGMIEPAMLIKAVTECLATKYNGPKVVMINDRET